MKWELYLSRKEWREVQAAVRERAPKDERGRPCCERCGKPHGKLKRSKSGYLIPHWLHTAHRHGADLRSKNPDDYFALCDACHMQYDRLGESEWMPPYRPGYQITTTGELVEVVKAVGLELWYQAGWCWRIGVESGGPEETPAQAVGAAIARLDRCAQRGVNGHG